VKMWVMGLWAGLVCCSSAQAQSRWFTVAGNPADAAVDTVQVDPVALRSDGALKMLSLRVSRAGLRRNWEGLPYRSYESEVAFDCRTGRADYRRASFYAEPLWQGTPHRTTDYTNDPKPMMFRDMAPNPTRRIVRAACGSSLG